MKFTNKAILLLSLLSILISCKKAPQCSGSCEDINSNGRVINKLTNTGAPNVPVTLIWLKDRGGIFNDEIIKKVLSKADGSFDFTSSIDTTYFSRGYRLALKVNDSKNFKILGYSGVINIISDTYNSNAFINTLFDVYKKAKLQININRTLNDNFINYQVQYSNVSDFFLNAYYLESSQSIHVKNKTIDIETVADIFTKIRVEKTFADGTKSVVVDSVKCTNSSNTIYNVTF